MSQGSQSLIGFVDSVKGGVLTIRLRDEIPTFSKYRCKWLYANKGTGSPYAGWVPGIQSYCRAALGLGGGEACSKPGPTEKRLLVVRARRVARQPGSLPTCPDIVAVTERGSRGHFQLREQWATSTLRHNLSRSLTCTVIRLTVRPREEA